MKPHLLTLLVTILIRSAVPSSGMLFLASPTNDVYVGVSGKKVSMQKDLENLDWVTNSTPVCYDDQLFLMFFCRTGGVNLVIPNWEGYFVKCEMRNAEGKKVSKSSKGLRWGADVQNFPAKPGRSQRERMTHSRAGGPHDKENPLYSLTRSCPSPAELFQIKDRGIYEMTMEVHCMKQIFAGTTNNWTWQHLKIPPFVVKVQKP